MAIISRGYKGKSIVLIGNNSNTEKSIELNNTRNRQYRDIIDNKLLVKKQNENYTFVIEAKGYRVFQEYY